MSEFSWEESEWEEAIADQTSEGLNDTIKGVDELKLTHRLNKTEEEIEKLAIDQDFNEVDRAIYILRKGVDVQKHSVLVSLINSMTLTPDQSGRILSVLFEVLPKERPHFQMLAAKKLDEFLQNHTIPASFADNFVASIRKMMECREKEILDAWSDVMIRMIQNMSAEKLESDILPEAVLSGGLAQPAPFRLWSCRIFGALAKRMPGKRVEATFLRKAISLCQDTDYEVRARMCSELTSIAKCVGAEITRSLLLNEYLELLADEEDVVRKAALNNFTQLVDYVLPKSFVQTVKIKSDKKTSNEELIGMMSLSIGSQVQTTVDQDTKISIIIPKWRKICEERSTSILPEICHNIGLFLWSVRDVITGEDVDWFVSWYAKIASSTTDENVKKDCAFNLPAMVLITLHMTEKLTRSTSDTSNEKTNFAENPTIMQQLISLIAQYSKDSSQDVKKIVAAGLPEIAAILGSEAYASLQEPFLHILSEEPVTVVDPILSSLDTMISSFSKNCAGCERNDMEWNEILFILLKRLRTFTRITPENKCGKLNASWILQMSHFYEYFDPENIATHVVPFLVTLMQDTRSSYMASDVQKSIVAVLCAYSRMLPTQEYREKIIKVMKDQFFNSNRANYRHRLLFLEFCRVVVDIFSSKHFKDNYFFEYLELIKDPIPNVRLKMIRMLPAVRELLQVPTDNLLLQKFNDSISSSFITEKDRGVIQALGEANEQLVLMKSGFMQKNSLQNNTRDKEREEEEKFLIVLEQEAEDYRRRKEIEESKDSSRRQGVTGKDRRGSLSNMSGSTMGPRKSIVGTIKKGVTNLNTPASSSLTVKPLAGKGDSGSPSSSIMNIGSSIPSRSTIGSRKGRATTPSVSSSLPSKSSKSPTSSGLSLAASSNGNSSSVPSGNATNTGVSSLAKKPIPESISAILSTPYITSSASPISSGTLSLSKTKKPLPSISAITNQILQPRSTEKNANDGVPTANIPNIVKTLQPLSSTMSLGGTAGYAESTPPSLRRIVTNDTWSNASKKNK